MPRRRLGVVLLVPEPWATEVQGLRRALGDRSRERVAPHITLVPPVNVREDDLAEALRVLRDAGSRRGRELVLELGPPRSFVPASDTGYLAVGGGEGALGELEALRRAVFTGPLVRSLEFPFVPHVTIADGVDPARIAAGVDVLDDYVVTVAFDRLHLLEEQRVDEHRRWVPVADAPFAAAAVVGRGGVELELTTTTLVDPEGAAVVAAAGARDPADADDEELLTGDPAVPAGAAPVVVTARRSGVVVAVARGWAHPQLEGEVTLVAVAAEHHGQGIGRQVHAALLAAVG